MQRGEQNHSLGEAGEIMIPSSSRFFAEWTHPISEHLKLSHAGLRPLANPYDNHHVMSLEKFIEHPLAKELLHNGQSYQVRSLSGIGGKILLT